MAIKTPSWLKDPRNEVSTPEYEWDYEGFKQDKANYKSDLTPSLLAPNDFRKQKNFQDYQDSFSGISKPSLTDEELYKQRAGWSDKLVDNTFSKILPKSLMDNWRGDVIKNMRTRLQQEEEAQNKNINDFSPLEKSPFVHNLLEQGRSAFTAGAYIPDKSNIKTGNKLLDFTSDIVGQGLGMASGGASSVNNALTPIGSGAENLAVKGLNKLNTPNLVNKLAPAALKGGSEFATLNALDTTMNGGSLLDTGKSALQGFGMGAAFGGGTKAIGEGIKGIKNINPFLDNLKVNAIDSKFNNLEPSLKPLNPSLEPKLNQSNANIPLPKNNLISPLDNVLQANKEAASTLTPKLGSGQFKVSELKTNTLRNSPFLQTKEAQKVIDDIAAQYEVKPNIQTVERATRELENNFDNVMTRIRTNGIQTAEDATSSGLISRELRQQAEKTGDYTQLKSWLETVQPKVTDLAQSLQALSTWKNLSPEGALMKAQQVVAKVNRDGLKEFGKKFEKVDLTNDEMKFINDTMNKIQGMEDGRAKDIEFAKVKQVISDKIPTTLTDKVKALQRISLLLNPKSNVRNVLGNTILGGLENIKDIPGSLIDKAVSLKTGERTTLLPSLQGVTTQAKGLVRGARETIQDARLGVDTNPSAGQFDLPPTQVFKKGLLGKLEKATNTTLEFGDRPFYQAAYDDALRQQLKINKVIEPTQVMMDKAKSIAEERTLQNVSSLVNAFKKMQTGLNSLTGNEKLGLGNFVLPFTKTPANILDKSTDYSIIGTIKAVSQLISKKEFNQKVFVDRLGRSLTGSAIMALGYDLAKNGLVTGNSNKDKDVAALERQVGKTPYSFKIGNTYRTFDWAQPAAIPLAIGADIYHQGKNTKERDNIIMEAIKSGGNTLFQQSLLQGLQRLFGGYNAADSIGNSLKGIPTQFVPTALKQITQLTDSNMRDTYSPSANDKMLNDMKSRVPGLSTALQPKIDTLGREVKQFNGNNNLFNVLVNPGYTNKYNPSNAEKLSLDLYNETGSTSQFPRVASDKITYKESKDASKTIQLTPQEKIQLQTYIGQETNKAYDYLYNLRDFNNKTSKDKVKELEKVLRDIYDKGEQQILTGRGINEYKGR